MVGVPRSLRGEGAFVLGLRLRALWLHGLQLLAYERHFPESSALTQSYIVDVAMLTAETLAGFSSDCQTLGLLGCYKKNGRFAANPTTTKASSTTLGQLVSRTGSATLGTD